MKITAETEKKPTIDETIGIIIEKAYPDKKHDIYVLDKLHETK